MKAKFFATPSEFRNWMEENHASMAELWVGFHKKDSGKASITWPESVDAALCFGWIDGIRKSINTTSYMIRFTPRRTRSIWSAVNIKRAEELHKLGLMHSAGHKVFQARTEQRSAIYAYEQRKNAALGAQYERKFRSNKAAWKFYRAQTPGYRKLTAWWVISAKREETRQARLARLIADSEKQKSVGPMKRPGRK